MRFGIVQALSLMKKAFSGQQEKKAADAKSKGKHNLFDESMALCLDIFKKVIQNKNGKKNSNKFNRG